MVCSIDFCNEKWMKLHDYDNVVLDDAKLVVISLERRLIVRKMEAQTTKFWHLWGGWPCLLRCQEKGRGEDYVMSRTEVTMQCESSLPEGIRTVEGVCTDADLAVERGELIIKSTG